MKRAIGCILYLLLGWCILKGWMDREAAQNPGLESLMSSLLTASPKTMQVEIQAPLFSLKLVDNNIKGHLKQDDHFFEFKGEGSFDPHDLNIRLTSNGDVAALIKHFHPQSLFVTGEYTIAVSLTGSWLAPLIESSLAVNNGQVDSLSTGAHFESITAVFTSDGNSVVLRELNGGDGQGGSLHGKGALEFIEGMPYRLDFEISHASLVKLNHVSGIFSGKLTLIGDTSGTSMQGSLTADSTSLALDETKPAPRTIDITYINQTAALPQQTKTMTPWPLKLDIEIASPKNIWITDQNLNSEWKAQLKLQGTAASLQVYGSLEMLQGHYMMNGKNVDIKEGKILFDGDPLKNSFLSVIGTLDTNTIIAEALVSGPLTNPSLTLRSNPPLPQGDILSHLIFGRGLADITPQQSKQLKKSLKDLKAMSTGSNILDGIRQRFGIDRIEISRGTGAELEDVSLQVGKYLTRGLYIAFNKGITSPTNRIILEAALRPNLKLQAEISDTAEGELHLKWRHDY